MSVNVTQQSLEPIVNPSKVPFGKLCDTRRKAAWGLSLKLLGAVLFHLLIQVAVYLVNRVPHQFANHHFASI